MRLRLSDPAWLPDLRQHFERSGFVTNRVDEDVIEVWQPGTDTEASRAAIEVHLSVWRAMHSELSVEAV
jgi:hypothetical protein